MLLYVSGHRHVSCHYIWTMSDRSKNYWEVLKISLPQQTNIKSGIHQKNVRVQTEQFWVGNFSQKTIPRCSNFKETVLHNLNKNFNTKSKFGGNIYHGISLARFLYRCYSILLNTSFKVKVLVHD